MNIEKYWFTFVQFCGAASIYLFGGFGKYMQALLILAVIDFATGIVKAWFNKKLESRIGSKGIAKKVTMFLMVTVAVVIQRIFNDSFPIRETVISFYILNEILSIFENVGNYLPIPNRFKDFVVKLQKEIEKGEEREKK